MKYLPIIIDFELFLKNAYTWLRRFTIFILRIVKTFHIIMCAIKTRRFRFYEHIKFENTMETQFQ